MRQISDLNEEILVLVLYLAFPFRSGIQYAHSYIVLHLITDYSHHIILMIDQLIHVHFSVSALLRVENPAPSRTRGFRGFNRFPAITKHKFTIGFCFINFVRALSCTRFDSV